MKEVIMQVASYSSDYPKAPIYVADLVRCCECEFSEVIQNDSSGVMARYCRAFTIPMMRSDDDFCSYGERKEKYHV